MITIVHNRFHQLMQLAQWAIFPFSAGAFWLAANLTADERWLWRLRRRTLTAERYWVDTVYRQYRDILTRCARPMAHPAKGGIR